MTLEAMPIKKEELFSLMINEAQKEEWHYSEEDVDFYFNYARNQIIALKIDNELAGCVLLHTSAGFFQKKPIRSMGFFLVTEAFRGQKIAGPFLMEKIIPLLREVLVCFHAVPKAVGFYERAGFMKTPLQDIFYAINLRELRSDSLKTRLPMPAHAVLKCLNQAQYQDVFDYNNKLFSGKNGAGICDFIREWIKRPDVVLLAYYEQGAIKGYGVLTVNQQQDKEEKCYRLSPLYADSPVIANLILGEALHEALQKNGYRMELNTLDNSDSPFINQLEKRGFVACGKNYVVCNQPMLITKNNPILQKIFSSLPLEYPHEVTSSLERE